MNAATAECLKKIALSGVRSWANSQNGSRFAIGYSMGLQLALDATDGLNRLELMALKNEMRFLAYDYGDRWNQGR